MLGLMYVGAAALYALVLLTGITWTWRTTRSAGGSRPRAVGYSAIAFLVLYLPVFWNHLPIAIVYRAACERDAGFHVEVPVALWLDVNRERLASVRGTDLEQTTESRTTVTGASRYEFFGRLLARENISTSHERFGMEFNRAESRVLDTASGAELSRRVDYSVGRRDDARIWLVRDSCFPQGDSPVFGERRYLSELKGERK